MHTNLRRRNGTSTGRRGLDQQLTAQFKEGRRKHCNTPTLWGSSQRAREKIRFTTPRVESHFPHSILFEFVNGCE